MNFSWFIRCYRKSWRSGPVGAIRCHILDATARGCTFFLGELKARRVYHRKEHCRLQLFLVFFIKHCLLVTVRVMMLDWMDF